METEEERVIEIEEKPIIIDKPPSKLSAAVQSLSFDNIDYGNPEAILQAL
jgi:hypothetical protein